MDFDTEVLVRLHWRGVRTRWIATQVRYPLDGVSHFRMFLDNVRMTSLHVRLVLGMLIRLPLLLWRKARNMRRCTGDSIEATVEAHRRDSTTWRFTTSTPASSGTVTT